MEFEIIEVIGVKFSDNYLCKMIFVIWFICKMKSNYNLN